MDLRRFRADAQPSKKRVWEPPTVEDFARGSVLAVDQSLAALGWVWLVHYINGLEVLDKGSVRTKPEDFPKSHEGTLQRALVVHQQWGDQVYTAMDRYPVWGDNTVFVHETPPVGSRMARPESSLLSALAVRLALQGLDLPAAIMVSNQHSKAVLVGNANAEKKTWHTALDRYSFAGAMPSNEGERDALCLALTYLWDVEREQR